MKPTNESEEFAPISEAILKQLLATGEALLASQASELGFMMNKIDILMGKLRRMAEAHRDEDVPWDTITAAMDTFELLGTLLRTTRVAYRDLHEFYHQFVQLERRIHAPQTSATELSQAPATEQEKEE